MSEQHPVEASEVIHRSAPGELVMRTFGPLADALGFELGKMPSFVSRNLAQLADSFKRKGGATEGELSSRLFKRVVDEGIWSEDQIVAEYLGGVLASSGTAVANDRGLVVAGLIQKMSALQLRAHFIFYSELYRLKQGALNLDLHSRRTRAGLHVDLDANEFLEALEASELSRSEVVDVIDHVLDGLKREDLIDMPGYRLEPEHKPRLSFHPTAYGAELFLWGSGSKVTNPRRFFEVDLGDGWSDVVAPMSGTAVGATSEEECRLMEIMAEELALAWKLIELNRCATEIVETFPNRASGYFFRAVGQLGSPDPSTGTGDMTTASEKATGRERRRFFTLLQKLSVEHPSLADAFFQLARALEKSDISSVSSHVGGTENE